MLPLRWKLLVLYASILTLVIAGFSVALMVSVRRALIAAVDTELEARAHTIAAVAEQERGAWILDPKSGLDDQFALQRGLYYLIGDDHGNLLLTSPLARSLGLGVPDAGQPRDLRAGDAHYRERTIRMTKPPDEEEGTALAVLRIVCGKDVAAVDFSLASLEKQLLIIGPLVLLLSLAGGLFLAGRALRPVAEIARTASAISATDLSRRIAVNGRDELGRLAATLNETFARLQESFERQTRFTADASHELRTPLSVVAGNVELALKRPRTGEEYRESLGEIQSAARRMQSIVEGLLALARADAGNVTLRRESVSLTALCEDTVRMCQGLAAENGVEVTLVSQGEGEVAVTGDGARLKELVSNLATNAIRYNRPGGTVTLRVSQADHTARLVVEDNGIGIPAADLPHVFERFYRVDGARSRDRGGSGLGLAIVQWIVAAHGGTIEVTSSPGTGSSFVVSLPA